MCLKSSSLQPVHQVRRFMLPFHHTTGLFTFRTVPFIIQGTLTSHHSNALPISPSQAREGIVHLPTTLYPRVTTTCACWSSRSTLEIPNGCHLRPPLDDHRVRRLFLRRRPSLLRDLVHRPPTGVADIDRYTGMYTISDIPLV